MAILYIIGVIWNCKDISIFTILLTEKNAETIWNKANEKLKTITVKDNF